MTRAVDIEGRGVRVNGRSVGVGVGSSIPEIGVSQLSTSEGSGTSTANEFSGQPDATLTDSSLWASDTAGFNDNVLDNRSLNEYVTLDSEHGFISDSAQFTFCVNLYFPDYSADQIVYAYNTDSNGGAGFTVGTDQNANGNFGAQHFDNSTNYRDHISNPLTDQWFRAQILFDGSSSVTAYVKTSNSDISGDTTTNMRTPNVDGIESLMSNNDGSSTASVKMFNPTWYDSLLTDSERDDDFAAQPYV